MKLRTSLQTSAVFPIVLAMMVSLSLVLRSRQVEHAQAAVRGMENLTKVARELQVATYDCLLRRTRDARETWKSKHSAMATALERVTTDSVVEQIVIERSRKVLQCLQVAFAEISQAPEGSLRMDNALGPRWVADSEALVKNTFELARVADENAEETRANADIFFAVFIGIMGLLMAAASLAVSRDAVQRLAALNQWAQTVSEGHLDEKMEVSGRNDEVGQVAQTITEMTRKLGVAYGAMEKEIVGHKKVTDALRESNVLLSNALERLKRAQHQIVQQERLHVLEQIARGVTHDFNNTLTPILGMSDFMVTYPQSLVDTETTLNNVKAINAAARQAKSDVKKLSEFFRPTTGSGFQPVDLNKLVADVVQLMEPRWKEQARAAGITVSVHAQLGEVLPVSGDRSDLREVLTNLILNALDAMPRGGSIAVTTHAAGTSVVVEVQDTGEGMSDDVREKCLEPFFSTKGIEGTGMGLTVVNNVVRRHGGTLSIRTAKGTGTTVALSLPAWKEDPAQEKGGQPPADVTRELRVLAIDDESWSRDIVSKMLKSERHHVDVAKNGREGLEKLNVGAYDLVITDRAMPGMSGDEVAAEVKRRWPQVPVILLTGFGDIMVEEGEKPEGVAIIVSKPITTGDLSRAVCFAMNTKR